MPLIPYPIRCIGPLALTELEITQSASLLGSTSRGLFIVSSNQRVIFLSTETYHGPWTANLPLLPPGCQQLSKGKNVQIQSRRLILPSAGAYFDAAGAERWQPQPANPAAADLAGLGERLRETVRQVLESRPRGFSALLMPPNSPIAPELLPASEAVSRLHAAIQSANTQEILSSAEALLGLGSGLTPSGDDLLCGLLLGLARWGTVLNFHFSPAFLPALLESARARTTSLSASLLEAAAVGLADERLLLAVDGLFTGTPAPTDCAAALLSYGNSSGVDFLTGLSLLLK